MQPPSVSSTNHLKKNYLSFIDGPILFTAPHSKKLYRGGKAYDERVRTHLREIYASYLAVYLARETRLSKKESNSFCVWGKSSQIDEKDLDPNYLINSNLEKSPFHRTLHKWVIKQIINFQTGETRPILHIDVHGKMNRENCCELDVGLKPMKVHWKDDPLIKNLSDFFNEEFNEVFEGLTFGKHKCSFNCEPNLNGFWGAQIYTMAEQAILMNIPSFQFEIPRRVRSKLFKDEVFRKNFAKKIVIMYNKVLTPWWLKEGYLRKLHISHQLANNVEVTVKNCEAEEVEAQLENMDKKAELMLNVKFV